MSDDILTPETAATLHAEAIERRQLPAWIVFQDEPDYPGKVIARFAIDTPTTFVMVADTLTEVARDAAAGVEGDKAPLSRSAGGG